MNLRDVLVFLDSDSASENRLKLATNIARRHGAHLQAIFLLPDETKELQLAIDAQPPGWSVNPRKITAIEIPRILMIADIAERRLQECLRFLGIDGTWHSLHAAKAAELIARVPAADLIILGQSNPDNRSASVLRPEKIVVACGRPALLVPYVGSHAEVGHRVLIAWDGSREAVRAVNDALPLINRAKTVTLMTVRARITDFEHDQPLIERVIYHLARHGVAARPEQVLRQSSSVSDVLLSRAVDMGIDLIVAGACHHSQLREVLIGGVSRGLFREMTVPVLMSH